ncbi:uncharacterized protein SPPG_03623 [Spizellomyces punctatus DAOM BR117]|uniref:Uncharacterized protein n=1 Tax=Spizellomyces punctatus (strain DAOM BR117) TaxID=645134 RepID=A0A0L0HLY5_SPIPD|nr:uncharacterized protein SPPG_03623 [Spizellomyces punctatus DAOM BR117]KND01834.1 hypothetical protein SPPG_03623 [Spizellomyces punctatus DAOM BR117]|eukprot:XP_016609873.1 hypothetical protein SPPG_03623 [Spizellomyces punctatus DAOM BR117]
MRFVGLAKALLQVVALTAVLLTWSSIGRVTKALWLETDTLHVWFGPPKTPTEIHVGEVYNATIEWESVLRTRKTYLNVSMEVGLRCAGGKDGGVTHRIDNWIVQQKDGSVYVDYPMTPQDLRSDLTEALCYLNIDYVYMANNLVDPATRPLTKDKAMSAVFKLTRRKRVRPLPFANATVLSNADRTLSLQLRVDESSRPRQLRLKQPLVKTYPYTAVSIWPEDDPEWTFDETVSMWALVRWIVFVGGCWAASKNERVVKGAAWVWDIVSSCWKADIEDPLAPRKVVRSRRRSFLLRDHLPVHVT